MFSNNKNLNNLIGDYDFEQIVKHFDAGPPWQIVSFIDINGKLYNSIIRKDSFSNGERTFRKQLEKIIKFPNFKQFMINLDEKDLL